VFKPTDTITDLKPKLKPSMAGFRACAAKLPSSGVPKQNAGPSNFGPCDFKGLDHCNFASFKNNDLTYSPELAETSHASVPSKNSHLRDAAPCDRLAARAQGYGRMKQPPRIAGLRWTPEDDNRLRALAENGRSAAVISERLKRSPAAVYKRAKNLGIKVVGIGLKAKRK
jgi:hypothetical protein